MRDRAGGARTFPRDPRLPRFSSIFRICPIDFSSVGPCHLTLSARHARGGAGAELAASAPLEGDRGRPPGRARRHTARPSLALLLRSRLTIPLSPPRSVPPPPPPVSSPIGGEPGTQGLRDRPAPVSHLRASPIFKLQYPATPPVNDKSRGAGSSGIVKVMNPRFIRKEVSCHGDATFR